MRRASQGSELIYNDDGTFLGVNCGWDFTSEHEWGIKNLEAAFGIDREAIGSDRYKTTCNPGGILYQEEHENGYLVYDRYAEGKLRTGELGLYDYHNISRVRIKRGDQLQSLDGTLLQCCQEL